MKQISRTWRVTRNALPQIRAEADWLQDNGWDWESDSLRFCFWMEDTARWAKDVLDNPETLQSMRAAAPDSIDDFDPVRYGHRILEAAGVLSRDIIPGWTGSIIAERPVPELNHPGGSAES